MAEDADRVRLRTPRRINSEIDHCIAERIADYAGRSSWEVEGELDRLDRAWSVDRVVVAALSAVVLAGGAAALWRRASLGLVALAGADLLRFALTGGGVAVAGLRRLGLRTRHELECERSALKALRGDFELARAAHSPVARAGNALQAALK